MSKLTIVATMELKPGTRSEVLAVMKAHRERCLRDEPGTLQFDVLVPDKEDDKILIYEVYRDPGASMKTVRTEIGERMVKMTGVRCASA